MDNKITLKPSTFFVLTLTYGAVSLLVSFLLMLLGKQVFKIGGDEMFGVSIVWTVLQPIFLSLVVIIAATKLLAKTRLAIKKRFVVWTIILQLVSYIGTLWGSTLRGDLRIFNAIAFLATVAYAILLIGTVVSVKATGVITEKSSTPTT